jgi:alkanesulfonate monooxygenase SsuD/methylene tetrahydromethanopterin reductase-like flavin-dependent oxidoreductase (luciferase family)
VPAGDAFTTDQRRQIEKARARAGRDSGLEFHVYVGPTGDQPREEAQRLHRRLPDAPRAVLVAVDPRAHVLEIVTGALARRILDDKSCGLAALSMQSAFAAGDLAGGIVRGLNQMGDHARQPEALHTEQV